jgi:RsiW-degrading membrane proteinase PrsW (M82 family)
MQATRDYRKLVTRLLYDSPLHGREGKIAFALIMAFTLYFAATSWIRWLTPIQSAGTLFGGMFFAVVGSLIGLVLLRYLDRRKPEPWLYFIGVLVVATLFTAAPAAYFNNLSPVSTLTVGFVEEFWKVFPLLMFVIFAPTVVTGVRDGLIYGALGGFGFNIMEISVYVLRTSSPDQNIFATISDQLNRLGWHGIENHVVWAALVGARIGYAV